MSAESNYQIRLQQTNNGGADVNVVAYIPESFAISTTANFERRFSGGLPLPGAEFIKKSVGVSLLTKKMTLLSWVSSEPIEFTLPLLFNAEDDPRYEVHENYVNLLSMTLPTILENRTLDTEANELGLRKNLTATGQTNIEQVKADATAAGSNYIIPSSVQINEIIKGFGLNLQDFLGEFGDDYLLQGPGPNFTDPTKGLISVSIGSICTFTDMVMTNANVELDSLLTSDGKVISAKVDVTLHSSVIYTKSDLRSAFHL